MKKPIKLMFENNGFGNRCIHCGGFYDDGNTCPGLHQRGEVYPYKNVIKKRTKQKQLN